MPRLLQIGSGAKKRRSIVMSLPQVRTVGVEAKALGA